MSQNKNRNAPWGAIGLVTFHLLAASTAAAVEPDFSQVLRQRGVEHGIVVQLGYGDGQRARQLHAGGRHVVQVLLRDAQKVAAARTEIQQHDEYGPLSIVQWQGRELPYADNLINMLVVDGTLGVDQPELLRVLCPLGVAIVREGKQWKEIVKPWPVGLDEWTHFLHDATGNAVSQDDQVGPPRRLQWSAGTMWGRSHEMNNSFAAAVTARGRMFYVFDKGLTGMEDARLGEQWTLIARDAFNGSLLWERPLATWGSHVWRTRALRFFGGTAARRLVVDKDKLFVTFEYGGEAAVLDAATGKTLTVIPGTKGAEEILVAGDHAFVGSRLQLDRNNFAARITCYDIANERVLWQKKDKWLLSQLLSVGDDEIVYHNKNSVVCLNRSDGSVRWEFADKQSGARRSGKMLLLADDKVVLSSRQQIIALSVADGSAVWTAPGVQGTSMREHDLFFAQGTIWCSGASGTIVGYSIKDGKRSDKLDVSGVQSAGHHLRCYRAKATENFLITQFRGVEFLSLNEQTHKQNDWLRGSCTYGVMPANGFLYAPPHSCLCNAAAMSKGLKAFAGESKQDHQQLARRAGIGGVEKGPAFGHLAPPADSAHTSWPSYRHDGRRSGATANQLSGDPQQAWKVSLATELTPPVAADGRLFVAAKNQHTLHAFDAKTGKSLWTFSAGARIDSPPTIYRGLLVFGCADGFLYCLRFEDGEIAWRRRLAPAHRWMAVDGQLESVWRLHGSVLIHDDLAYCIAGRSSYLDGGLFVYAVDITTGEVRHRTVLNTVADTRVDNADNEFVASYHIEGAQSDLLVAEGGFIYLNQYKFSRDLELQPAKYLTKEEVTRRPSMNLDGKEYVNEDIFNVQWRGKTWKNYDQLAGILVDEHKNVGERDLGLHLYTTSGFLDTSFFNRTYWMYSKTWTGFNHANLAPKSGQLLVVGPRQTYALKAYTSRYALSPKLDPQTKGYLLIADDNGNEPTLDPRAWGKDKGMGFSRGAPPKWYQWLPVRVQAMVLAGDTLVVCGPPDAVKEGDPLAAFEGRMGSQLWTLSSADGKTLAKHQLAEMPIFDGMIAAENRLYLCTSKGDVICMAAE